GADRNTTGTGGPRKKSHLQCRSSGTVPRLRRCRKKWGRPAMPSAAYFRRQADICLRLSLIASDEEVSNRLIVMAGEYAAKADTADPPPASERTALPDLAGKQAALRLGSHASEPSAEC